MAALFEATGLISLHAALSYPASNKETRAMTIAAFRIAQNSDELTMQLMDKRVLKFLLANSTSALNHWKKKDRLLERPAGYSLTPEGLGECEASLDGLVRGYSTSEGQVARWVRRMLEGDDIAIRAASFESSDIHSGPEGSCYA